MFDSFYQVLASNFPTLFKEVVTTLAGRSLSSQLAESATTRHKEDEDMEIAMATSQSQPSSILTYMNPAKISDQQRNKIELLMFKMFICCALPWVILNNDFFVAFVLALAPSFHIPDRSVFFSKHLAQETANWSHNFQKFLANKIHLSLSLDGWSTRANEEIYTFHTTTPKRRSFFTDGHVFKGISITGDALKAVVIKVRLDEILVVHRY